jgi:hypothetical protein
MPLKLEGCAPLSQVFDMPVGFYRDGLGFAVVQVAPYGMKQLWLNDPDGSSLCFQWRVS